MIGAFINVWVLLFIGTFSAGGPYFQPAFGAWAFCILAWALGVQGSNVSKDRKGYAHDIFGPVSSAQSITVLLHVLRVRPRQRFCRSCLVGFLPSMAQLCHGGIKKCPFRKPFPYSWYTTRGRSHQMPPGLTSALFRADLQQRIASQVSSAVTCALHQENTEIKTYVDRRQRKISY